MRIKVKKVTLPSETEALLRWVRRKWQAITSFTEVPQANIIIKQIGTGTPQTGSFMVLQYLQKNLLAITALYVTNYNLLRL